MGILNQLLKSSIGKKIVMAASGAILTLFLLGHLAGISTLFVGREVFNSYAEHLHSLGFLLHLFEAGLLIVFLIHITFGLLLYIENLRARPIRYALTKSNGGRTMGSRSMPYTGLMVLAFLIVHLNNFQGSDSVPASSAVQAVLSQPGFAVFYGLAILALALHLSHGWWSMFQTLGLNDIPYDQKLRTGALAFSLVIGTIFLLIPALALFLDNFPL